jgi:hypothetical protein
MVYLREHQMKRAQIASIVLLAACVSQSFAMTRTACAAAGGTPTWDTNSKRPGFTGTYCSGGSAEVRDQVITDMQPKKNGGKTPPTKRPTKLDQ